MTILGQPVVDWAPDLYAEAAILRPHTALLTALLMALLAGPACSGVSLDGSTWDSGAAVGDSSSDDSRAGDSEPTDSREDIGGLEDLGLSVSPPGRTFVDSVEVTVTVAEGVEAWYTLDGSLPERRDEPVVGPITLTDSAQLRVVAVDERGQEAYALASYIELRAEDADFSSNLPLVVISTDDGVPDDDARYTAVHLQIMEPGDDGRARLLGEATSAARAGLKVRGSSSAGYPKKSFALETWSATDDEDTDHALLGMPEAADWALYAPLNFDRALMRNAFIYELSRQIDRYAVRTRFVEVFAAGGGGSVDASDYLGVYVFMERIERGEERVNIAKLSPEDLEEPEITGGYIFKRDRVGDDEDGFTAGTAGGTWEFAQNLVYVDPREEEIERDQARYLKGALDAFGEALAAPDHRDPETGAHYRELIDVDAWIDHHALNLLTKNPDALRLSGYLYKDRGGLIVAGPIWDFDRTMGCASDGRAEDPTWWDPSNITTDTTYLFEHGWYRGLFDDPEFSEAYWARLADLLEADFSVESMNAVVDRMAAELSEAAPRNFARWSDYGPRGGSFEAEVDHLKGWLADRHAWMSDCIERYPSDPEQCPGR